MDREEFVLIWHGQKKCYGGLLSAICSLKIAKRILPVSATGLKMFCRDSPPLLPVRSILCCLRSGSPSQNNFSISGPPSSGMPLTCISLGAYVDNAYSPHNYKSATPIAVIILCGNTHISCLNRFFMKTCRHHDQ